MNLRSFMLTTFVMLLLRQSKGQTTILVQGTVADRAGTPIPYCNVTIKGTKVAAMTNNCGEFELPSDEKEITIVFSCMSTHDFVTFEKRINLSGFQKNERIVFRLKKHGKTTNKNCNKKLDNKMKKNSRKID